MKYKVYYSDPEVTAGKGFSNIAEFPCIFDARPGYHRLASEYLIDCGLRLWSRRNYGTHLVYGSLTEQTLRNQAYWVKNVIEWAEVRGVSLLECEYWADLQKRYQRELGNGTWSRLNRGLDPRTINTYVDEACSYVRWLAFKGYRKPFEVPTITRTRTRKARNTRGGSKQHSFEERAGKLRTSKAELRMPTDKEISDWCLSVYARAGKTLGLACETVLLSAVRKRELVCWRVDTLPENPVDWKIKNPSAPKDKQLVQVVIMYGAKGKKEPGKNHDDEVGPKRPIFIPLHMAEKIHKYYKEVRPKLIAKWIKQVRGVKAQEERKADAVHLFRDEKTGDRITAGQLYRAWKKGVLPFKEWTVHFGRDWWACATLLNGIRREAKLQGLRGALPGHIVESLAMSILANEVQPQLGHIDISTTNKYVVWATGLLQDALPSIYQDSLDAFFIAGPRQ